jgi:hypothetical protein
METQLGIRPHSSGIADVSGCEGQQGPRSQAKPSSRGGVAIERTKEDGTAKESRYFWTPPFPYPDES